MKEELAGQRKQGRETLGAFTADLCIYVHKGYPHFPRAVQDELALHSFVKALALEWLCQHLQLHAPTMLSEALAEPKRVKAILSTPVPSHYPPAMACQNCTCEAGGFRGDKSQWMQTACTKSWQRHWPSYDATCCHCGARCGTKTAVQASLETA